MIPSPQQDRWLLPEGVEEALPQEAQHLEQLRRQLLDLFDRWGYELVMPPFIEYLESLLIGTGSDLDLQTFKLIDQLTGRLMGVRADMTPQVARIEAHRLRREAPVRLCYLGTVLHTRPEAQGGSRSPLQLGAELYGHPGVESDVEVVRLMLEALALTGVEPIHLDLGHVGIFRGLARQAGLSVEQEAALFDALQRKAIPEIEALLPTVSSSADRMLLALAALNGGDEVLEQAEEALQGAHDEVLAALAYLRAIAEKLRRFQPKLPLHFDLAELRGYRYHTGLVFAAYVPSCGQAIAQGGRYDDIGRAFGRARPATGFSSDLRALAHLKSTPHSALRGIYAPPADDPELELLVGRLRAEGDRVIYGLPGQSGGARELGCDRELAQRHGTWQVIELEEAHG
jgi:ATP phosphoribosyltransferase regulatory subunit